MSEARKILLIISGFVLGGIVGGSLCGFGVYCLPLSCWNEHFSGDAALGHGLNCDLKGLTYGVVLGAFIGGVLLPIAVVTLRSLFRRLKWA